MLHDLIDFLPEEDNSSKIEGLSLEDLSADAGSGNAQIEYAVDHELLRGALISIPADEYDVWVRVGLALKSSAQIEESEFTEEEAYEFWIEWSSTSLKFDEDSCMKKWEGMNPTGAISLGSVFHEAKQNGWQGNRRLTWNKEEECNEVHNPAKDATEVIGEAEVQSSSRGCMAEVLPNEETTKGGVENEHVAEFEEVVERSEYDRDGKVSGRNRQADDSAAAEIPGRICSRKDTNNYRSDIPESGIGRGESGKDCNIAITLPVSAGSCERGKGVKEEKGMLLQKEKGQVLQGKVINTKAKNRRKTAEEEIEELNEKHFVVQEGGKTRIITERYDRILQRNYLTSSSFEDFRNFYCNRFVMFEKVKTTKKGKVVDVEQVPLGDYWIKSELRRQYNEIVFIPGVDVVDGCYNLWRGWSVDPSIHGDWSLLREHIYENICSKNEEHFEYYMNWMARAVQKPDEAGCVAIVLKGNRGVGKGTAVGYFGSLFGQHYIHVTSSRQVTGNFNSHLRDGVLLFSDEAVYAGNKSEEATLKGLITEQYLTIEAKGKDIITAKNNLHVMMASNNDWAVPAGTDERRFFVLNVSDSKKQDTTYFTAIRHQMASGGLNRMLYDLMNRDISKFQVFDVPKTEGLLEQKIETFDNITAWWYDKLQNGYIFDGIDWEVPVPAEATYQDYIEYSNGIGQRHKFIGSKFGKYLSKMQPDEWPKMSRIRASSAFIDDYAKIKDGRIKHYHMCSLDKCREVFEKAIGQKIDWENPIQAKKAAEDEI